MSDGIAARRREQEQLAALLQELQKRRESDPLERFVPHPKQKAFIDATLSGRFKDTWFIAANRAGKSDAGAVCGARLARFGNPDARFVGSAESNIQIRDRATSGWVSALDFPTSRDTIQPKYFNNGFVPPGATHEPFIPDREIEEWRTSDQVLRLKNGSIIGFKSADSGASKYQGAEKEWVHLDEEHPEAIVNEITIRVGARGLRTFNTCTLLPPLGQKGGITWVFPKIIEPFLRGENRDTIALFGASIYDNPHIPVAEIEYLESRFPPHSTEGRIRLGGEWLPGLSGSRAYTSFDRRIHVRPQPAINLRRPLCWSWDFNVDPMVTLIGQIDPLPSGRKLFRVYRELVIDGSASIGEMCQWFYEVHPMHYAEIWIYGDSTGKNRHPQTAVSNYTIILNEMRSYNLPIRLKLRDANPPVPDRINAVNRIFKDEAGDSRCEIDPTCIELIADLEQVLRDGRGGIKKSSNPKDAYSRRTHASDDLGYWIEYEEPVQRITAERQHRVKIAVPKYGRQKR
jgi:hypothetical protein